MADNALNLTLSDYTLSKIMEKATAVGVSPEELAILVIEQALAQSDNPTTGFREPASTASVYDPDEPVFELEDVLTEFSAELERRLALKA